MTTRLAIIVGTAITTAALLYWDREFHTAVRLPPAPAFEQHLALAIWVGSLAVVLGVALGTSLLWPGTISGSHWPWGEVAFAGVLAVGVLGWLDLQILWRLARTLGSDLIPFAAVYAIAAVCFCTGMRKAVIGFRAREWFKASVSAAVTMLAAGAAFATSGMTLFFV